MVLAGIRYTVLTAAAHFHVAVRTVGERSHRVDRTAEGRVLAADEEVNIPGCPCRAGIDTTDPGRDSVPAHDRIANARRVEGGSDFAEALLDAFDGHDVGG